MEFKTFLSCLGEFKTTFQGLVSSLFSVICCAVSLVSGLLWVLNPTPLSLLSPTSSLNSSRSQSTLSSITSSDVNKDLGLKAKAKAKAKDSDPEAKAKAKDLGPKAKAKDCRYQG